MRNVVVLAAALAAFGSAVAAETIRCQSQGYCTMERNCFPDSSVMRIDVAPDGSARYGWVTEDTYWFEAPGLRSGNMRVWLNHAEAGIAQSLVITDDGIGTFQIANEFDGTFYASMQVLSCQSK